MPTTPDVIENLPNGWKKLLRTRNSGASVGGKDVYIIDQRNGLRFRSTRTLAKHIQKNNLFATVDPNVVNFERPGEMKPKTRIHKDFVAWIYSKGTTNPKFLQIMQKKKKQPNDLGSIKLKLKMKSCQQCESYTSIHHVRKQSNGTEICELCEIGQTNPFRVLEMVNDSSNSYYLPLETIEDANRLSKQTNLSPGVINDWLAKQLNNMPNNNDIDTQVKIEPATLSDTEEPRENKEIIRKRRPINFTLEDLTSHESEEEDWKATSPSKVTKKSPKTPSPLTKSKRVECQKHSNMKVDFGMNQAASKINSDNKNPSLIKIENSTVLKTRTENDGNVRPKREIKSPKKYADFITAESSTGQEKTQIIAKTLFSNEEDMIEIHDIIDAESSESWNVVQSPFLCLEKEKKILRDISQSSTTSKEGEIPKFQGTSIKVEADDELFAIKTEQIDEQIFKEKANFDVTIGDSNDVQDITIVVKDELLEENTNPEEEETRSKKTHLFNSEISDKVKVEDKSISYDLKVETKSEETYDIIQIKDVYSESAGENSNLNSFIPSTSQIPCYDVPDSDSEEEDDDIPDDIG